MGKVLGNTVEITIGIKYDKRNGDIHIYFRGDEHDLQPVTVRGKEYDRAVSEDQMRLHKKLYERLKKVLIKYDRWPEERKE